jgi:putative drug exporter of the RND superfamily
MQKLSRLVLGHKLLVTLLWLVVAVAGAYATIGVDDRLTGQWALPGQPAYEANQAILNTYGSQGDPLVAVIGLPAGQTVDSPGVKAALAEAFAAAAEQLQARVVSYADTRDRRFVSSDQRTTFGLVWPVVEGNGRQQGPEGPNHSGLLAQAMQPQLPAGATLHVTGMDPLESGQGDGGGVSVLAETLLGGLGALAVLVFVFGSLLALVPLLVAAISIAASFLVVYGLTEFVDVSGIVQFIVALIGLGVAIDYSLLLVTRWREEHAHGHRGEQAVARAMATAGRSVLFSGGIVAVGLLAMVILPVPFLQSIGYGGMVIPLVSMLVVLTLLPVILATAGRRLDWPHLRKEASASRGWTAWARGVVRFRWAAALACGAVLIALAAAALGLHLGQPQSSALARSGPASQGLVALERAGVPSGILTPVDILVPGGSDPAPIAARLGAVSGVHTVVAPQQEAWRRGGTALLSVLPTNEGSTDAGKATITRIRDTVAADAQVGGAAPESMDFVDAVYGAFPLMLILIALVTFLVLARGFRSLLLPLKAVVLNLLSLGAIIGAMVLVWQHGYGSQQLWGITATGSITEFIPVMVFAFLYGLSMDYEVFILARMREAYDRTGTTGQAIVEGIGRTGRLVTSAALVLFLAFASLAAAPQTEIKVFATGLGLGVLLDATLIRALLVPALVSVMDQWNWWLPAWAARLLRVPPSGIRKADAEEPQPAGMRG